jgi:hypothetical protein
VQLCAVAQGVCICVWTRVLLQLQLLLPNTGCCNCTPSWLHMCTLLAAAEDVQDCCVMSRVAWPKACSCCHEQKVECWARM